MPSAQYDLITPASLAQYVQAVPSVRNSLVHALWGDPRHWRVVAQAYAEGLLWDINPRTLHWMAKQYGAEAKPSITAIERRLQTASPKERFRSLVSLLETNDLDQAAERFKLGRITSDLHERTDVGVTLEQFRVPGIPGPEWRVEACSEVALLIAMMEGGGIDFGDGGDSLHKLAAASVHDLADTVSVVSNDDGKHLAVSVADVAAHTPWLASALIARYAGQAERESELMEALERRMLELSLKANPRFALLADDLDSVYGVLLAYAEHGLLPSKEALQKPLTPPPLLPSSASLLNTRASSRARKPAPANRATASFLNAYVFPRDSAAAGADTEADLGSLWSKLAADGCVKGLQTALARGFAIVDEAQPVQPLQRALLSERVEVVAFLVENKLDFGEPLPSTPPDMLAALQAARAHRMLSCGSAPQAAPRPLS